MRRAGTPLGYLAAVAIVGVTVVPLLFVVVGGFRTTARINADPAGLSGPWIGANYKAILGSGAFWAFLGNSALIAVIATALAVGLGSMAGFALSRYTFKGREAVYTLFTLGLLENFWGVAIPETAFSLPMTIVIPRPFGVALFLSQTARVLAFTALSMIPVLRFFVLAERRIVGGLTGSVKG